MKRVSLSAKERLAFLYQQLERVTNELDQKKPPLRLHEHLLFDQRGRPTNQRYLMLDGGRPKTDRYPAGERDDVRCGLCEEVIKQTVLNVGLPIPVRSTAFEVGSRELFKVASDKNQLRVTHETYVSRHTRKEAELQRIDDLLPVVALWLDRLITQVLSGRPVRLAAPVSTRGSRPKPTSTRREFPKTLYRGKITPAGTVVVEIRSVKTERNEQRATAEGWVTNPVAAELAAWNVPRPRPDYPKMLYRGKTTPAGPVDVEQRIVNTEADEQLATADGWLTNPEPEQQPSPLGVRTLKKSKPPTIPRDVIDRPMKIVFAQNLKRLFKETGWSYEKFAEKMGIDRSTVIAHCTATNFPKTPELRTKYTQVLTQALKRPITPQMLFAPTPSV